MFCAPERSLKFGFIPALCRVAAFYLVGIAAIAFAATCLKAGDTIADVAGLAPVKRAASPSFIGLCVWPLAISVGGLNDTLFAVIPFFFLIGFTFVILYTDEPLLWWVSGVSQWRVALLKSRRSRGLRRSTWASGGAEQRASSPEPTACISSDGPQRPFVPDFFGDP
ncbi:MAG: hypothetical protein R3F11_08135 [Verrucomicrobiales bacterium]